MLLANRLDALIVVLYQKLRLGNTGANLAHDQTHLQPHYADKGDGSWTHARLYRGSDDDLATWPF
jgi:hypothetical protein